jgi:hypothetical protein
MMHHEPARRRARVAVCRCEPRPRAGGGRGGGRTDVSDAMPLKGELL